MPDPACVYCHTHVDPSDPSVYQRVTGWERKAFAFTRRGGSDIVLREPVTDTFACLYCIDKLKAGVNVSQETLL
jgi:hypothetical protein